MYAKFGVTAEAAELFETDLNTLLLAVHALNEGWHVQPNPEAAQKVADDLDAATLGALLNKLKSTVTFDDGLKDRFASALKTRNRWAPKGDSGNRQRKPNKIALPLQGQFPPAAPHLTYLFY